MTFNWGDLISLEYGKPVPDKGTNTGSVPVFGTNGQIGTTNQIPLCPYPSFVIGRKGAYRGVHFSEKPFSVIDTAFYVKSKTEELDLKWAYYKFLTYDINKMDSGSAIPSTDRHEIYGILVDLPPLNEQQIIAGILSSLDQKIVNNSKINHHLEQMARSIWSEQFGSCEPNGVLGDIIELFDYKRIPLSGNQREKMGKIYPYYGAASLMDYVDDYLFDGIFLLLGEDGTVIDDFGFPMLQYVWGKFWVNNHAHILQGRNGFTVESLYILLKQTSVSSIVTGAVQPKINQANLKALPVIVPNEEKIKVFNALIDPLFAKIRENSNENQRLATLRDALLPRLMSGELSIADVDAK